MTRAWKLAANSTLHGKIDLVCFAPNVDNFHQFVCIDNIFCIVSCWWMQIVCEINCLTTKNSFVTSQQCQNRISDVSSSVLFSDLYVSQKIVHKYLLVNMKKLSRNSNLMRKWIISICLLIKKKWFNYKWLLKRKKNQKKPRTCFEFCLSL